MSDRTPHYSPEQARAVIRLELGLLITRVSYCPGGLALLMTMRDQLQQFAKATRRSRLPAPSKPP